MVGGAVAAVTSVVAAVATAAVQVGMAVDSGSKQAAASTTAQMAANRDSSARYVEETFGPIFDAIGDFDPTELDQLQGIRPGGPQGPGPGDPFAGMGMGLMGMGLAGGPSTSGRGGQGGPGGGEGFF